MIENEVFEERLCALKACLDETRNNATVESLNDLAQINLFYGLHYLDLLQKTMRTDVLKALKYYKKLEKRVLDNTQDLDLVNELQYAFRCVIRCFFAEVEALTFLMRQMVVAAHERKKFHLRQEERIQLKEEKRRNSFITNFDLAFRYYPKLFKSGFKLNKDHPCWNDFKIALKARDTITHPKSIHEFCLSADIYISVQKSLVWFTEIMAEMNNSCLENSKEIDPEETSPFKLLEKKAAQCPR